MTLIRLSGSQLHAARVLVGLSREEVAGRAGLSHHSIRERSRLHPGRDLFTLVPCRCLSASAKRFSGDGVYALCGEHHDQAIELVLAFINSESLWTWLGPSRRRMPREHEHEPRSAKVLQWCAARLPSSELVPQDRLPNPQNKFRC
jgi:hypothetical protein